MLKFRLGDNQDLFDSTLGSAWQHLKEQLTLHSLSALVSLKLNTDVLIKFSVKSIG